MRALHPGHYYDFRLPIFNEYQLPEEAVHADSKNRKILLVTNDSPLEHREALEKIGVYFKREVGTDFRPYTSRAGAEAKTARSYCFLGSERDAEKIAVVGGCTFSIREWRDAPPGYCLEWIWLHPYERDKGRLSGVWEYFTQTYGEFFIQPPYSRGMCAFLEKHPPGWYVTAQPKEKSTRFTPKDEE